MTLEIRRGCKVALRHVTVRLLTRYAYHVLSRKHNGLFKVFLEMQCGICLGFNFRSVLKTVLLLYFKSLIGYLIISIVFLYSNHDEMLRFVILKNIRVYELLDSIY